MRAVAKVQEIIGEWFSAGNRSAQVVKVNLFSNLGYKLDSSYNI